eukprot:55118-Eustigmatos_ZCMA.PRE.1
MVVNTGGRASRPTASRRASAIPLAARTRHSRMGLRSEPGARSSMGVGACWRTRGLASCFGLTRSTLRSASPTDCRPAR